MLLDFVNDSDSNQTEDCQSGIQHIKNNQMPPTHSTKASSTGAPRRKLTPYSVASSRNASGPTSNPQIEDKGKQTPREKTISAPTDLILPIQADPYMAQIVDGTKNYEFRKYRIKGTIKRVWFYLTAPTSAITHVCEVAPARTRKPGDPPLTGDGIGNAEFNNRHKDWDGCDYAYEILSVYELHCPISLREMKDTYDFHGAPRGQMYLPIQVEKAVQWDKQKKCRWEVVLWLI